MRKIGFVVDSTFGLKEHEIKDISVVPLKVIIEEEEYVDGTIDNSIVVKALKEKKDVKTSQPSPSMFVEAYEKQFELGYEHVICLTLSGTLSGTVNGANLAKNILENEKITVIDTQTAAVGSQYIIQEALRLAEAGKSIDEVLEKINEFVLTGSLLFSVDDLSTLVKNGRLRRMQALIGSLLRIKPILRFDKNVLSVEKKAKGIKGVYNYIKEEALKLVEENKKIILRITYVDSEENASNLKAEIDALNNENIIVDVMGLLSPVISAHIGLGGLGVYFIKK